LGKRRGNLLCGTFQNLGVAVEEEEKLSFSCSQAEVGCGSESLRELISEPTDLRKLGCQQLIGSVCRAVVDDENFGSAEAGKGRKAASGESVGVPGRNDHGKREGGGHHWQEEL
jgi:hypothetical protein